MFGLTTLLPFVFYAVYLLITTKNRKDLLKPTPKWGPQEINGQRVDRSLID